MQDGCKVDLLSPKRYVAPCLPLLDGDPSSRRHSFTPFCLGGPGCPRSPHHCVPRPIFRPSSSPKPRYFIPHLMPHPAEPRNFNCLSTNSSDFFGTQYVVVFAGATITVALSPRRELSLILLKLAWNGHRPPHAILQLMCNTDEVGVAPTYVHPLAVLCRAASSVRSLLSKARLSDPYAQEPFTLFTDVSKKGSPS
mgnify:CR=1 FL=1